MALKCQVTYEFAPAAVSIFIEMESERAAEGHKRPRRGIGLGSLDGGVVDLTRGRTFSRSVAGPEVAMNTAAHTHHVHILEMNGDSYRLNQSKRRARRASSDPPPDNPTKA